MNRVFKYALAVAGFNLLLFLVMLGISLLAGDDLDVGLTLVFFIPLLALLLELVFGIVYITGGAKKHLGGGLLIGSGISMLITLSGCGIIANI